MKADSRKLRNYLFHLHIRLNRHVLTGLKHLGFSLAQATAYYLSHLLWPFQRRIAEERVDFLVLTTHAVDISRKAHLWSELVELGYTVKVLDFSLISAFPHFLRSLCYRCSVSFSPSLFYYDRSVAYLLGKYRPKAICGFKAETEFPSILRHHAHLYGARTVYIPHAVVAPSIEYTSFDYDYYLVFGASSIVNARNKCVRLGSTKLVKVGSPNVTAHDVLAPNRAFKAVLYFSNWLVGIEKYNTESFLIFRDWAAAQKELDVYIKLHPIENPKYVQSLVSDFPNIKVLDQSISMRDALEPVSLVITTFSNASIEAAIMNRPTVIASAWNFDPDSEKSMESDDYLHLEQFFPSRSGRPSELAKTVKVVFDRYDHFLGKCSAYVQFHISGKLDSGNRYVEVLQEILHGSEDFEFVELPEILEYEKYSGDLAR